MMKGEAIMIKRWLQATLLSLGLAAQAHAQMPPSEGGPFNPPTFANNPVPLGGPQFCPAPDGGPIPKEPESPFSLKNDGSPNAFDDLCPGCKHCGFYAKVGPMGLMRQSLGNSVVGVMDPGVNIPGIPANVDTGNLPPMGAPTLVNFNSVYPNMSAGVRAAVGWREGDHAFELSGFYMGTQTTNSTVSAPGQIDLPFGSFPTPIGFQGDNGLWLQADQVNQQLLTRLASGEANYRMTTAPGFEFLFGVRYVNYQEAYLLTTLDDSLVKQPVNPTQVATVGSVVHNQIVGPQLGFEYELKLLERLAIGMNSKGMWGANFMDREYFLMRGDGFVGPHGNVSATLFSQTYEINVFADILLWDQVRMRVGYMAFWVVGVPEANQQINFDPSSRTGLGNNNGSAFFHGPMLELQIAF